MAVYDEVFPDGTPYPPIPLGTNTVNVSSSSALSSALSSAAPGDRIILADGSYSGDFTMSGKAGTAANGISVEAANVGGATISSGSTWRITNCSYVTVSGLMWSWQGEGETFQFRGSSHHCRLTRCTFGPSSHTESSDVQTWIYVGDDCYHVRIDHNEIRNKGTSGNGVRVYGSFDKVDNGQGSSAGCRWVRIDHNIFRSIKPEVGNDKEPVRYGVSTMSRTIANGVIERNHFEDCICEPELISVKMGGIRTTGNTMLRCAGGPVIRHGTNSIMNDNYVVDRVDTFGETIGSGGIRFYDADHDVRFNYIDGVYGGNFQGPLLLDTGDAEGSSSNLSAHWRVIGALVERNVLVSNPEGIRIGDNYSSVPRDCTIRDNLVVDTDSGAAITQRVAPSNTVLTNNTYYASTSAAGMTQDADTIWRKPGYGPRLTYLTATDVGPSGDLEDTDGTGAEVDGTAPVAVPADVLNIGPEAGQNHFQLQWAADGAGAITITEFDDVAAGFAADPYFVVVDRSTPTVPAPPAVQFRVRADAATTPNSTEPRSELRETRADGSEMAFDAMTGDHSLRTRCRVTHLPAADPEVVVAQLHNGVTGDRISVRTQLVSGQTKLLVRINGTQANPRLSESYVVGTEFEIELRVLDGGAVEVYYGGSSTPIVTGQLEPSGAGASWYWKVGAYAAFNETTVAATEYVSVEHRDLVVTHGGYRVDAGADAQVVAGQTFSRDALEVGLTGITSRRWSIVARPTPEEPDPEDPPADMTQAAIRHGWGTPHALSDEFNYTGPPNSTKWKLPGQDWAGHNGNGRRRPERTTVDGSKLVMTGLANGDSGWCQHRLDVQYGRWEARVRSFAGAPSAGEPDSTSNGNDYHPLLLLWPESNSRQTDGEYDFMENGAPGESTLEAFIHYPHPGTEVVQQEHFERPNSSLHQFHNIAMEWTSQHIKGFFDGVEWFSVSGGGNDVRRDIQTMPAGHLVIQLDNFDGTDQTPATIEVEWFRYYLL
ncbi:MAG TPA: chondroitinase-B domain-containing protein [Blastococcus sp.]|nr:chondroitinase-B domain-containing protein [Blastococcus sp.]